MKTLTDEWYIIIKAYKFEILRILYMDQNMKLVKLVHSYPFTTTMSMYSLLCLN